MFIHVHVCCSVFALGCCYVLDFDKFEWNWFYVNNKEYNCFNSPSEKSSCSAQNQASAEYWKYFTVRFDGVHAFGCNCAESEPIWMKSGAL